MPTQYLTFILRVRLEPRQEAQEATPEHRLSGSLQQAGSDQVYYFDSIPKLQDALTKTLTIHPPSATP